MELITRNKKIRIFFYYRFFPKESAFSLKESDVPNYFIILDVSGQREMSREE